ncbi:ABC transporter ATP-binding protein [Clostridium intestinale]|uniref:ABC-type multidrug transport system, ATPase component n=1 Tax=Clostridium intestinale DSM 6191 TaxID=1121320 RepID=A0A1M5SY11_9CLOT|nr:ABC transporter ATP-binding protein [Clostridium intestinale]SHH43208.1 ABC-type multidrug transport system, ATPase component [Clostridium intestinale DSM 6191]
MLEVNNITKSYGKFKAVKDISFKVEQGEIAVLVGPNGAGKSTIIKSIAGLLKYEGEIKIGGKHNKSIEGKRLFNYVPEMPAMYPLLTVDEHIHFIAKAYGLNDYKEKAEELLKTFDMVDKRTKLGQELSKGMQQKVSIMCGLITNPKLILFDEPMIGLDPKAIKELKNYFAKLKESGAAIIISTHLLDSVQDLWDRILIMKEGEIILSKTKGEFNESGDNLEEIFFEFTEEN